MRLAWVPASILHAAFKIFKEPHEKNKKQTTKNLQSLEKEY